MLTYAVSQSLHMGQVYRQSDLILSIFISSNPVLVNKKSSAPDMMLVPHTNPCTTPSSSSQNKDAKSSSPTEPRHSQDP